MHPTKHGAPQTAGLASSKATEHLCCKQTKQCGACEGFLGGGGGKSHLEKDNNGEIPNFLSPSIPSRFSSKLVNHRFEICYK